MLEELLKYLNSYKPLIELIGKERFFPIMATDLTAPALEYTYKYIMGGVVKQSQFSINIVWTNYDEILAIEQMLESILDFDLKDTYIQLDTVKFNSAITGGSVPMYRQDLKLYLVNMNFIINWKKTGGQ